MSLIAKSIICSGPARFLQQTYLADVTISGSATLAALTLSGNLSVGGSTTMSGTLAVTGASTFTGTVTTNGAAELKGGVEVYGSTPSIDFHYGSSTSNYTSRIIESTSGTLSIYNNVAVQNQITAPVGVLTTVKSATIKNSGQLISDRIDCTNIRWVVAEEITVASLGGTFYVAPTIYFTESQTTVTINSISGETVNMSITDPNITTAELGGHTWKQYSWVKLSGGIGDCVLGTSDGYLAVQLNTTSHVANVIATIANASNLTVGTTYSGSDVKDLAMMMYKVGNGSTESNYKVGMVLTSYGDNYRSYLDIYSGASNTTVTRLGNLGGLEFNGQTLSNQWGLLTTSGYFDGCIYSDSGKIGHMTLSQTSLYSGEHDTYNASNNGFFLSDDYISAGSGAPFYVDKQGNLYASSATITGTITAGANSQIGPWHVTATSIYKTNATMGNATAGAAYFGDDGLSITDKFKVSAAGALTATSGTIGGIHVVSSAIYSGSHSGYNSNNAGFYLGSDGKFGVGNNNSYIRYNGSDVTMNVTSLSIGGDTAATQSYADGVGSQMLEDAQAYVDESINDAGGIVIMGTQTASTSVWTGNAPFASLQDGQIITYYLPYAATSTAVTLNLTLTDGTTTGQVNCYYLPYSTTRLTTHWAAGSSITMIYRKNYTIGSTTYTGWWASKNPNTDTYDRVKYAVSIKASAAIVAGNIIVGNASGYHHLKTGGTFDVSYPILYAPSAISSGSTSSSTYVAIPLTITTTQAITLTAHKAVYIKGSLAGTTFTPVSTTPLTQTVPTTADGYYYIYLGRASSTIYIYLEQEHPIYVYDYDAFQPLDKVAKNYLYYDATNGLVVSQTGEANTGYNTQIKSNGIYLRSGSDILSKLSSSNLIFYKPGSTTALMNLSTTGLQFNNTSGTKAASLTSTGLEIVKGSITLGDHFSVNNAGAISASSGTIGGWTVSTSQLLGATNADSSGVSYGVALNKPNDVDDATNLAIRVEKMTNNEHTSWPFYVRFDGMMHSENADITGNVTATSGTIGGITINDSYGIYTNSKTSATSTNTGFLISKNGAIYLGAYNSTNQACPFQVTAAGALTATNATITGAITATSGTIGGITLNDSYGIYTNGKTTATSTNTGFLISKTGAIYIGAYDSTLGSCPFQVTAGGALKATSGSIAGWTISSNQLLGTTDADTDGYTYGVALNRNSASTDLAIRVEKIDSNGDHDSWPFYVRNNGYLHAENADITGTITSTSGTIGPWSITSTAIYKGSSTMGSSTSGAAYFGDNGLSITDKFQVTAAGALTATDATITGDITASGGTIGGFVIGSKQLYCTYTDDSADASFYIRSYDYSDKHYALFMRVMGSDGNNTYPFYVRYDGFFRSTYGMIASWNVTDTCIYKKSNIMGNSTTGAMYFGDDGLSITNKFTVTSAGILTASGATIGGTITATDGAIGPWDISSAAISTGSYNTSGTMYFGTSGLSLGTKFVATAAGAITATEGTIGGITMNSSYGLYTNSKTSATSTNTGFLISKNGAMYIGAYDSNIGSCPFQITSGGAISARSGTIGGWRLSTNQLLGAANPSADDDGYTYSIALNVNTEPTDIAIRIEKLNSDGEHDSYPFYIRNNGALYANNATIVGSITAESGTIGGISLHKTYGIYTNGKTTATSTNTGFFISKAGAMYFGAYSSTAGSCPFQVSAAGAITANSGTIGGWTINSAQLIGVTTANSSGVKYGVALNKPSGVTDPTNLAIRIEKIVNNVHDSWPFYVRFDGKLHSEDAEITGSITATTLTITDDIYLQSTNQAVIHVNTGDSDGDGFVIGGSTSTGSSINRVMFVTKKAALLLMNTAFAPVPNYPSTSTKYYLGASDRRWTTIYSVNALNTSSDVRDKTNIANISQPYKDLFMSLRPVEFTWKKGDTTKKHLGVIAQEVVYSANELGIAGDDMPIVTHDIWDEPDETGRQDGYSMTYEELHMLTMSVVQDQQRKINDLQNEIDLLKKFIDEHVK